MLLDFLKIVFLFSGSLRHSHPVIRHTSVGLGAATPQLSSPSEHDHVSPACRVPHGRKSAQHCLRAEKGDVQRIPRH